MRIKVEFNEPSTGKAMSIEMDGPEMDPDELRDVVLDALEDSLDLELPDDFNLKITEIVPRTLH